MSPGIIGTYWLLGSFTLATAWAVVVPRLKRTAHHAGARCYRGTCQR